MAALGYERASVRVCRSRSVSVVRKSISERVVLLPWFAGPPVHSVAPKPNPVYGKPWEAWRYRVRSGRRFCHALADGLSLDRELARLLACSTYVGETQKVEGLRFPLATLLPVLG